MEDILKSARVAWARDTQCPCVFDDTRRDSAMDGMVLWTSDDSTSLKSGEDRSLKR